MDTPSIHSSTSSQRRRLTKKNPSQHYIQSPGASTASSTLDPGYGFSFDDPSSNTRRSSHSLRRAPSAPPIRSTHSGASNTSISSPRPAHRPNHSPSLAAGDFASPGGLSPYDSARLSDHLQPLNQESGDDLIGAPFDGTAILNRLDASKPLSPGAQQSLPLHQRNQSVQRPHIPLPLGSFGPDKRPASPPLRSSASFSNMDPSMSEKMQGGRSGDRPVDGMMSPKRYSDDGKDLKSTVMRKKTGLSGFVNSLVGSQKKPVISAPENPVHVTHVGYDSSTGQFTVCLIFPRLSILTNASRDFRKSGSV